MKKTLTVTWYKGNYGSTMQAFALQHTLLGMGFDNKLLNINSTIIDKIHFLFSSKARFVIIENKISAFFVNLFCLNESERNIRKKRFETFYTNFLRETESIYNDKEIQKYSSRFDFFLCGSDQIWNPSYYKGVHYLDFVKDGEKKFSYAASIGVSRLSKDEKNCILNHLKDFKYISVREVEAKNLLQPYLKTDIKVVADPVCLVSQYEWIKTFELHESSERYLLCYFLGKNKKYWELAKKIAKIMNLKIKTIPNSYFDYKYGLGLEKTVGPKEWLNLIYGAQFIITDSFHATAFSLIFNRSFYVVKRFNDNDEKSQNSRVYNILRLAGVENRIVDCGIDVHNVENLDVLPNEWDKVNIMLNIYREDSLNWLSNALKVEKK